MKTLILLLLLSTSVFAQEGMVLIEANEYPIKAKISNHVIMVQDSLAYDTVKLYEHYMETNPVNYEGGIRRIERIKMIEKDRYFVSGFSDGTLYLNARLNNFPATKEVVIVQELAVANGMVLRKATKPHLTSRWFNINEKNEEVFRRQLTRHSPYKYAALELEELSPLKSKR